MTSSMRRFQGLARKAVGENDALKASPVDSAALTAQCRQLVRNIATPGRLRSNQLARAILDRAPAECDAPAALKEAIALALDRLSARDRRIIERCDLDREVLALVAAELRISERHLYRERQRIFERLAVVLLAAPGKRPEIFVETIDSIEQLVKTSRALEENGACTVAAEVLERRALESADPLERTRLFLRLAELHARSGSTAQADESLEMALRNAAQIAQRPRLVDAEVALTRAHVLEAGGEAQPLVLELSNRSIQLIRSAQSAHYDHAAAGVLVRALALRAQAASFVGDLEMARGTTAEMRGALANLHHADADSRMAALFAEFLTKALCDNDLDASADCLGHAMQIAQDSGLSVSSILLAVNLASLYRLRHDPGRAAAILASRLEVARVLGNRRVLPALLIELASAHLDLHDYRRAKQILAEAIDLVDGNRTLQAPYFRVSAATSIRMRLVGDALESSRAAGRAYESLGKSRLVGSSLKLQAEALLLTGDRRAALAAIRNAIDALSNGSHRSALASAYAVMGRISGNFKHLETARQLGKPS
jgi:tetratricopeptide (TPR) repeat protein